VSSGESIARAREFARKTAHPQSILILAGAADLPTWNAKTLRSILDSLRAPTDLTVDWELEAGEGWCRLSDGFSTSR
jgi:hypothetical protein